MKIKIIILISSIYLLTFTNIFSETKAGNTICEKWNLLDNQIVTQTIDVDDAIELLKKYEPKIKMSNEIFCKIT